MSDAGRRARAAARASRVVLHKAQLQNREADPCPIHGPEALSLVHVLTQEGWSLAGLPQPSYTRDEIPCRFVPGPLE
ncbi:MAG: hypothetical protein IT370_01200 [Deltaproteobacteria bacterium]|nr:hypothetical protein [Deltaproteobacteria bacterium]